MKVCSTAASKASSSKASRCSPCNTTPKPPPAPWTPTTSSTASWKRWRSGSDGAQEVEQRGAASPSPTLPQFGGGGEDTCQSPPPNWGRVREGEATPGSFLERRKADLQNSNSH